MVETGVLKHLRCGRYNFFDGYKDCLAGEDVMDIYRKSFGAKTVIIIAGINKLVKNIDEAVKRVKNIAAPKNCVRLNRKTYCAENGHCVCAEEGIGKGCNSADRICRHYLVSSRQAKLGRIKVIIVNEELGY